jgi:hypothetical protein
VILKEAVSLARIPELILRLTTKLESVIDASFFIGIA